MQYWPPNVWNNRIFLSLVLQAAVKLTWSVPLAWRLVSSISIPSMSVFLICLLIWRWHGQMAVTKKVMAKYANPVVLILDEWLLLKPTDSEQRDIFELLHRRRKKSSTIFCSQYEFEEWYDQLGGDDSPLTDAIIDRIAHDSYRINITSIDAEHDRSMREVYGLDKALRE